MRTVLIIAAMQGHEKIVEFLLTEGSIDIFAIDKVNYVLQCDYAS
jgi:hypothetical protein